MLNTVIGVNGSGKSNLIEIFRFLQYLPRELSGYFNGTGGVEHWFWKGVEYRSDLSDLDFSLRIQNTIYQYSVRLSKDGHKIALNNESISFTRKKLDDGKKLTNGSFDTNSQQQTSVFARLDNSILLNEMSEVIYEILPVFNSIAIYSFFDTGRLGLLRRPQDATLDSTSLSESAGNLALVLNDLQNQPQVMRTIINRLKEFYPRVENIITRVQGGTVQIYFQEEGLTQTVPATRLSDGTLRYLCLLVILCHPTPPPLICIEEPELGMHPDIIPTIAELLIEASERTQLIVTTHSSMLVSAIGQTHPDAVVVCERGDDGTQMRRLDKEQLAPWLADYSLGDIWMKGLIGGTRW